MTKQFGHMLTTKATNRQLSQITWKANRTVMLKQSLLYLWENTIIKRMSKIMKTRKTFRFTSLKDNRDRLLGIKILMLCRPIILLMIFKWKILTPNIEGSKPWLNFICQWMKISKKNKKSKQIMKYSRICYIRRNIIQSEKKVKT